MDGSLPLIRAGMPGDEAALARIQVLSWKTAFADILSPADMERFTNEERLRTMYAALLQKGELHSLTAVVDGENCALLIWGKSRDPRYPQDAELICIHCLPQRRGQGIGGRMISRALEEMRGAGYRHALLWVFEKNIRARKFYEAHGFADSGISQMAFGAAEMMYRIHLC